MSLWNECGLVKVAVYKFSRLLRNLPVISANSHTTPNYNTHIKFTIMEQRQFDAAKLYLGGYNMNIPQITSIENAIRIYYSYSELGNKEISHLFGRLSSATVSRLKKAVKDEMAKREILSYGMNRINTRTAYAVWGLDINDLERRMKKLKDLNL